MSDREQKIVLADQLHAFQQTELYQALVGPVIDEKESLRSAYDCKTLLEMATLKGQIKGLDRIFGAMLQIETEAETARAEIRAEVDRALKNKPPEDSSEL